MFAEEPKETTTAPSLKALTLQGQRKIIDEFFASYGQLIMSGDDMNIIQVGRPAVSRYHQVVGFYPVGEGPNFAVHDFPNAEYGIKLAGS